MYYKRRYGKEVGVGGWGGCNNVMWTALDWDLLKPWGCCFVEDVVTLQVSLLFTEGGCNNVTWTALGWDLLKPWGCCFVEDVVTLQVSLLFTEGGWGGVITSCGLRWIETCWNLEDVASLKTLLRCKYRCCLQKGGGGCKNVMWTALDWDLLKPWGCCFVEGVVTLQVSLLFTDGGA